MVVVVVVAVVIPHSSPFAFVVSCRVVHHLYSSHSVNAGVFASLTLFRSFLLLYFCISLISSSVFSPSLPICEDI